jgi:site-specific DNA recombinase
MSHNVAIYARISSDREGEARGVDRQKEDCLALIERHPDWRLDQRHIFVDNDISAYSGKRRPEYERLMAAVERGEVDVIVAWHVDRLTRKPIELEHLLDLYERTGVLIATVTGEMDLGTDSGRLMARMLVAFARAEMERKAARQRRAELEVAQDGGWHGQRPYGFQITQGTDDKGRRIKTLAIWPVEADMLREAANRVVIDGDTEYAICKDWNERGVPSPKGGRWHPTCLRRILMAPRNVGIRQHEPGYRHGKRSDATVSYPASWPSILDRDTYDEMMAILDDPSRCSGRSYARRHLLAGFLVCGKCGHRMGSVTDRRPRYACRQESDLSRDACRGVSRVVTEVDRVVVRRVFEWLEDNGLYDQAAGSIEDENVRELRQTRRRLESQRVKLVDFLTREVVTEADYKRQCRQFDDEIVDVDRALARHVGSRVIEPMPRGSGLKEAWAEWEADGLRGLDERRRVIAALVDRVVVHPTRHGRVPFDPSRVQVFPAAWAEALTDPGIAAPEPVPDISSAVEQTRDLMAAHPGESFTVAEVAEAMSITWDSARYRLRRLAADDGAVTQIKSEQHPASVQYLPTRYTIAAPSEGEA